MARTISSFDRNVFINCPFDTEYKPLFDAALFSVQIAGFKPRCALEASNAGQFRLEKILEILSDCRYGLHDISRTELSRNNLPRFNMPLELGLDLGCRRFGPGRLEQKRFLVMDRTRFRYQRFISDIAGQDIVSHGNSPRQLIRNVRDWLSTESRVTTIPGGDYMYQRYRSFQRILPVLRDRLRFDRRRLTFLDYSSLIRIWLEENEV